MIFISSKITLTNSSTSIRHIHTSELYLHARCTSKQREQGERSTSSGHEIKRKIQYRQLFFPDFCRSFRCQRIHFAFSFSHDNGSNKISWGT